MVDYKFFPDLFPLVRKKERVNFKFQLVVCYEHDCLFIDLASNNIGVQLKDANMFLSL